MRYLFTFLLLALIFSVSAEAAKIKGYYINREGDTIAVEYKIKMLVLYGQPDYNKLTEGIKYESKKEKKILTPDMCKEAGFNYMGEDFVFFPVRNRFHHFLKVYSSQVFLAPRILGPVNLYYSTYTSNGGTMGPNGMYMSSTSTNLGWILEKHNGRTLHITYGSGNKKDLLRFFNDWKELESLFDERELRKSETIKIVDAYNTWYENTNDSIPKSLNYNIRQLDFENDSGPEHNSVVH